MDMSEIWVCFSRRRLPCPGRGAAFFMPLRRAGTVPNAGVRYGPGSAAHHHSASKTRVTALMAKGGALRCVRGTYRRVPRRIRGIDEAGAMTDGPPDLIRSRA